MYNFCGNRIILYVFLQLARDIIWLLSDTKGPVTFPYSEGLAKCPAHSRFLHVRFSVFVCWGAFPLASSENILTFSVIVFTKITRSLTFILSSFNLNSFYY